MESRRYKRKGLGKYDQGIEELPADMFDSNERKSGIGSKNRRGDLVSYNNDEELGLKMKDEIVNML